MAGFKVHVAVYLGVAAFFWGMWFLEGVFIEPWPLYINIPWGLGLFLHYVGGILSPKWKREARMRDETEKAIKTEEEAYFSSEYSMDELSKHKENQEDWDGVDVSVHDIDD